MIVVHLPLMVRGRLTRFRGTKEKEPYAYACGEEHGHPGQKAKFWLVFRRSYDKLAVARVQCNVDEEEQKYIDLQHEQPSEVVRDPRAPRREFVRRGRIDERPDDEAPQDDECNATCSRIRPQREPHRLWVSELERHAWIVLPHSDFFCCCRVVVVVVVVVVVIVLRRRWSELSSRRLVLVVYTS